MTSFPKLYKRSQVITRVEGFEPRLASWNAKDHPDQIRLRSYLDDLYARVQTLPDADNLFLDLRVDVREESKLMRHHDVENYLTPLFGANWFDYQQFPLVCGSKHVGNGSTLTIGTVTECDSTELDDSWCTFSGNAGYSPTTKQWKQRLHESVGRSGPVEIPQDRRIEFHMAFRCSSRRNWVWLWKPTGDALSPILGHNGPNKFNPNDDRITSLEFHRFHDDSVGHDVHVGLWWRPMPQ